MEEIMLKCSLEIQQELVLKIQYLEKALNECMEIIDLLKKDQEVLNKSYEIAKCQTKLDLSKIRGD